MTNKKNTDREKIKFYNRVFPFEERNDIIFFSFYVYIYLYIYIIYYTSFFLFLSFIYFYFFFFSPISRKCSGLEVINYTAS